MTGKPTEQQLEETRRNEGKPAEQNTAEMPEEIGGRKGPEPTRYGDWEKGGICTDF